ncbi:ABC transporter substrate-binding protein [Jeotgalibacillus proteolyticus]|uniref:ABC transporter substrate-binding protein n=1 Tax=Jeotgalibacillus proteolyticus TaxID=2082395 RepID=A0A2S5GFM0_9BACL|nr:sugar ABC transporter substrate-binding protein [Jeotgalibacillus proteolyticus]PPA71711.1 ABC transporter substrate-binding protein [Jeotgalibacillus proteolyticus]
MNNRSIVTLLIVILIGSIGLGFILSVTASRERVELTELTTENQVVLTFWRNYGNPAENLAYEKLVQTFEKENPSIKIEMNSIEYGDYELRLRTEIAAGKPPDIMSIDSPNLALYARTDAIRSLNSYMKQDGVYDDLPESVLQGLTYNGEVFLSPVVSSGTALFYNKHLFKEANLPYPSADPSDPITWEEVVEAAKKINDPEEGIIGIDPAEGFSGGESAAYFKLPILWQFGADVLSPDGKTADGYLNSPKAIEALQFYQNLYHKEKVAAIEMPYEAFERGLLGMTILGSWALENLGNSSQHFKLGEDFGVAALPKGEFQVVPNGGWSLGISSKSAHPDEAWAFIEYISSFEGMETYVELTGDIPARHSVAAAFPEFYRYPKNIFLEQEKSVSKNRPVTPAYPIVSSTIKTLFEDIGIRNQDVKESADRAVRTIDNGIENLSNE